MAFTGRAIYDSGVFDGVAEDVSDIISMIAPYETPLLNALPQAVNEAQNVLHEWLEDDLAPNTLVSSTLSHSTTAASSIEIAGGLAAYMQTGAYIENSDGSEVLQVTAVSGNYITVARAQGGTAATSYAPGYSFYVVSDAALEGADVNQDTSRPRVRLSNYTQIIKKDIIVSGTMEAVRQLGGVGSEMDYQRAKKTRESLRDLERALLRGKLSGNTLGSATAYRTMKGLWDFVTTNNQSIGPTLTESWLANVIQAAWDYGGTDVDLIICDKNFKRTIDSWNSTRTRVTNAEERFKNRVTEYESTFGLQTVVLNRWMRANSLIITSSQRIRVLPLRNRSFRYVPVSRTGDSEKGMIIGEYTVEVRNEAGMAKAYSG